MRRCVQTSLAKRVAVLVFAGAAAYAQTSTGGITGTVTDPAGAVVPGAALSLTNLDTNNVRREVTNAVGVYTFTTLPPGRYKLELQQRGFKRRHSTAYRGDGPAVCDAKLAPRGRRRDTAR